MSTVYTYNNKVLKNSANDKWLAKKEAPIDPYNPLGLPANPPTSHSSTFNNCGRDTTTGAAELAQIPSGWK